MTIYLVTSGEYSDYHLDAAFSTRALAEAYIEEATKTAGYSGPYCVEEWTVDEDAGKVARAGYAAVILLETGEVRQDGRVLSLLARPQERAGPGQHREATAQAPESYQAISYVSAEHARKLAVEWREGWLRERVP